MADMMNQELPQSMVEGLLRTVLASKLQQQMQESSPEGQLRRQLLQEQLQKAQRANVPGSDLASIFGGGGNAPAPTSTPSGVNAPALPGDVLGGGPGAPITFGRNPRTGALTFNNFGWVTRPEAGATWGSQRGDEAIDPRVLQVAQQYSTPERQQAVEQARGGGIPATSGGPITQLSSRVPSQAGQPSGVVDTQAIEKLGQFNTWADKNKIPSQIRKQMSDQLFPWAKEEKALTPEQYSKLYRMNPQTGQLESPQSEMSAPEAIKQGYKVLTPKQLETFYAADQLDAPLQQFKDILAQARGENPWALKADQFLSSHGAGMLSPLKTAGLGVEFNKSLFNVTQMFDQMVAGARGAASPQLTQLRQQALPGILNSPALRDRLMQSFEGVVDNIKRVNKAKALGIAPAPTDLKSITSFESQIGKINQDAMSEVGTSAAQVGGVGAAGGLPQGVKVTRLK